MSSVFDRFMKRFLFAFLLLVALSASAEEGPHQRLDWFPDGDKESPIETVENWETRRVAILNGFQEATGKMPSRDNLPDLDIKITETDSNESYARHTITFQSEKGDRTPAYLYIPENIPEGEKRIGIVALHPTHKIGKGVVDGQSERPNRAYALEMVMRGHVVIAPDYLSFGDYSDYDFENDAWESGTAKAIWNHMRCVDLLTQMDEVDDEKVAAIGHSLGGHNAIFLGVFDERVKAVVSSCGWTPFHDYYEGKIKGWTSDRYMPSLRDRYSLDPDQVPFDFYELVAAIAPRAFFSNSPLRDANFDWRGVEKAAPKIRKIYELYGAPRNFRIAYPNSDHDFPDLTRLESYEFIENALSQPDSR